MCVFMFMWIMHKYMFIHECIIMFMCLNMCIYMYIYNI